MQKDGEHKTVRGKVVQLI